MEPRIIIKYCGEDLEIKLSEARKVWEQLDKIFNKIDTNIYPTFPSPNFAPMPFMPEQNPFKYIEQEDLPVIWCGNNPPMTPFEGISNDGHYGAVCKERGDK